MNHKDAVDEAARHHVCPRCGWRTARLVVPPAMGLTCPRCAERLVAA